MGDMGSSRIERVCVFLISLSFFLSDQASLLYINFTNPTIATFFSFQLHTNDLELGATEAVQQHFARHVVASKPVSQRKLNFEHSRPRWLREYVRQTRFGKKKKKDVRVKKMMLTMILSKKKDAWLKQLESFSTFLQEFLLRQFLLLIKKMLRLEVFSK